MRAGWTYCHTSVWIKSELGFGSCKLPSWLSKAALRWSRLFYLRGSFALRLKVESMCCLRGCVWSTGGNQCFYEFMNIVWGRHKGKRLCITLLFSNCTHWAPHTCHSLYGRGHHIKLHSCIWSVLGNPHDLWNVTLLNCLCHFTFISQCSIFQFKVLFVLCV